MSIASLEAAYLYRDEYWPGYEPRPGYAGKLKYLEGVTTDELRHAYVLGRTADIVEREVEAAAASLAQCEAKTWEMLPNEERTPYRTAARTALTAARKTVDDDHTDDTQEQS